MVPAAPLRPAGLAPPPLHLGRRLGLLALGLGAWAAFRLLSAFPGAAEVLVGSGPLPLLPWTLSLATGVVPFSLAELVILGVLLRQGLGAARGFGQVRRGLDTWPRTLLRGGLRLGQDMGVLVLLFYLLWGFQYARPGLDHHLEVAEVGMVEVEELEALARQAVRTTNRLYLELHGEADVGVPTPALPMTTLLPSLEAGWVSVGARFDMAPRLVRRHGEPKPAMATRWARGLGIAGIYFPFTGEALFMGDLPGVQQSLTLAHEMAHQRGIASESDANVLGFLVGREADHPLPRYAAHAFLQRQLVSALSGACPPCTVAAVRERLPGVQRDLDDLALYWAPARGPVREATTFLNHAMLQTHGVREGVASYRGSTWVFVAMARRDGPEALFGPDA